VVEKQKELFEETVVELSIERGRFKVKLEEPIEYAKKGDMAKATHLIFFEPVKDSSYDCLTLTQMAKKAGMEYVKMLPAKTTDNSGKVGEEQVPFHKQKAPDPEKLLDDSEGLTHIILSGDRPAKDWLEAGKKLLTTRYSSAGERRLCRVDDEDETGLSTAMFDSLSMEDKLLIVSLYATFFDLSSVGQRKTISSKPRG